MSEANADLTEKEKETLRLIVRGHDAKSAARELDLSVHTINERLRAARRKLDVTSSREAARLLFEEELETPENLGSNPLGDAKKTGFGQHSGNQKGNRALWVVGGSTMSMLVIAAAAATLWNAQTLSQTAGESPPQPVSISVDMDPLETVALDWLAHVDKGEWQAGYGTTAKTFRQSITLEAFRSSFREARGPLGEVAKRTFQTFGGVRTGTADYKIVRFETDFEHRAGAVETVILEEEGGVYKVSGYWIS